MIVSAALTLQGLNKVYVDINHPNRGKSAIINADQYVKPNMTYLMGYDLSQDLSRAMQEAGFEYAPAWKNTNAGQAK